MQYRDVMIQTDDVAVTLHSVGVQADQTVKFVNASMQTYELLPSTSYSV